MGLKEGGSYEPAGHQRYDLSQEIQNGVNEAWV